MGVSRIVGGRTSYVATLMCDDAAEITAAHQYGLLMYGSRHQDSGIN